MGQNTVSGEYRPTALRRDSLIPQAAGEICRYIDATGLKPGDALPPETRLSEMLGISRNSVREALRMLHGLNVIEKMAGRGTVVTATSTAGFGKIDQTGLAEAAAVAHQVRMLTMQRCAELAAERLSEANLREMEKALDALAAASSVGDRVEAKRAHDLFYGLILSGSRNPLLVSLFTQAASARLTTVSESADKTFLSDRHIEQHRAVLQALRARDPEAAAKAIHKHFLTLRPMIELVTGIPSGGSESSDRGRKAAGSRKRARNR